MADQIDARVKQKTGVEADFAGFVLLEGEMAMVRTSASGPVWNFKVGPGVFESLDWSLQNPGAAQEADTSTVFPVGVPGLYIPTESGDYGPADLPVDITTGYTQLIWDGTTLVKAEFPIDLSGYVTEIDARKEFLPYNFDVQNKNMFNKGTVVDGETVSFGSGAVVVVANAQRSAYIDVKENTTYTIQGLNTASYGKPMLIQTAAGVLLQKYNIGPVEDNPFTFTTPADAGRIVFATKIGSADPGTDLDGVQLEFGAFPTAVEPFTGDPEITGYGGMKLIADNIPLITTESGKNRFDKSKVINGQIPSYGSGVIVPQSGAIMGTAIVQERTEYTIQGLDGIKVVLVLDGGGATLAKYRPGGEDPMPLTFTTPPAAESIAFGIKNNTPDPGSDINLIQVELGSAATAVEPFTVDRIKTIIGYPIDDGGDTPSQDMEAWTNLYPNAFKQATDFLSKYMFGAPGDYYNILAMGSSVFGREGYTTQQDVNPALMPPSILTKNIVAYIFQNLSGGEIPAYQRYDAGGFTETGTWTTETVNALWFDSQPTPRRPTQTRVSVSTNAAVQFSVGGAYDLFNWLDRTDTGATTSLTVAISGGSGQVQARLDDRDAAWEEANGFTFSQRQPAPAANEGNTIYGRRIQFRKVGSAVGTAVTVTVSKTVSDSNRMMYWGLELASGSRQYGRLHNLGLGFYQLAAGSTNLSQSILTELTRQPDLVLLELCLINTVDADKTPSYTVNQVQDFLHGDRAGNTNTWNLSNQSGGFTDFQVVCIIPQIRQAEYNSDGTLIVHPSGYTALDIYNAAKAYLISKNMPFIDINAAIQRKIKLDGLTPYEGLDGSGNSGATYTSDGTHLNDKGTSVFARHLCPIFDVNQW